jgi:hypothetical protein
MLWLDGWTDGQLVVVSIFPVVKRFTWSNQKTVSVFNPEFFNFLCETWYVVFNKYELWKITENLVFISAIIKQSLVPTISAVHAPIGVECVCHWLQVPMYWVPFSPSLLLQLSVHVVLVFLLAKWLDIFWTIAVVDCGTYGYWSFMWFCLCMDIWWVWVYVQKFKF